LRVAPRFIELTAFGCQLCGGRLDDPATTPSVDTQLMTFQDEQIFWRIRSVPVQLLALAGRIEVVLLSFDTSLELVVPGVVPQIQQRDDDHRGDNDRQEDSSSHV